MRRQAARGPPCCDGRVVVLQFHVVISLVGILAGFVMLYGLLESRLSGLVCAVFLATTVLTSLSGFPLEPFGFDPPRAVGILSLILLAAAIAAYYLFHLGKVWRWIFVFTAMAAFYLNVFVLVTQLFMKAAFLKQLAPTQTEPPFVVSHVVVLLVFIALGVWALIRFHPGLRNRA
jgi:lysylphosphatidylglycerol synthetase-like protein (DUF2156 family)